MTATQRVGRLALQRLLDDQLRRQAHHLRPTFRRLRASLHQRLQPLARARRCRYPLHGVLPSCEACFQTKPPLINARILEKLIPNARLVTIEDGHLFLVTSAGESAKIVSDFLR